MENNATPKQDGQWEETKLGLLINQYDDDLADEYAKEGNSLDGVHRVKDKFEADIEAYCTERERLARNDEVVRVDASGWTTRELEVILGERLSELRKQSSSKEDHGAS